MSMDDFLKTIQNMKIMVHEFSGTPMELRFMYGVRQIIESIEDRIKRETELDRQRRQKLMDAERILSECRDVFEILNMDPAARALFATEDQKGARIKDTIKLVNEYQPYREIP